MKLAFRHLLKHPGFATVIVLSLAIGIGANALVFTWIRATLFNAVPGAADPARLTVVVPRHVAGGANDTMALADIETLARETQIFSGITGSQFGAISVRLGKDPEWVWGQHTMANFFEVLGVPPALGRGFLAGEDRPGAAERVVIISYELWQRHYGGDPKILGRTIEHHQHAVTIVGVAPPGFYGTMGGLRMDMWMPLATELEGPALQARYTSRSWRWLHTVARLAPGISLREGRTAANMVGSRLAQDYPAVSKDTTLSLLRVWESPWGAQALFLPLLRALALVAALLLLLVSANVANLLLARAQARQREIGVRLALGASATQLIRQMLGESFVLAILGGAGGIALAQFGAHWLIDLMPATYLPIGLDLHLNAGVLVATIAVTLVTGLLFGLAPALNAARTDLNDALKTGSHAAIGSGPRQWARRSLVAAEVGLALVLLVGMGLCIRSFREARRMDLGLNPHGVWVAGFRLSPNANEGMAVRQFYQRLHSEALKLPGVVAAGLADGFPLGFEGGNYTSVEVPGYQPAAGESLRAGVSLVSPGYFETLRIPLLSGRDFLAQDDSEAAKVAVVNEAFAKKYFRGREPVGLIIKFGGDELRIVGVVATGKHRSLSEPPLPYIYASAWQRDSRNFGLALRTDGDPHALAAQVTRLARSIDPTVTPHASMTYEDFVAAAFAIPNIAAILLTILGVLALLLAAMGIYAVMAQSVGQRTREFGVRLALGAHPSGVRNLIIRQGMRVTGVGLMLGLVGAAAVSRLLRSLLVGVSTTDPLTWLLVPLVLLIVTLAAVWFPARRASSVDPMSSLRSE